MKRPFIFLLITLFLGACSSEQGTLPDDYLPFKLNIEEDKISGESEFLEGFNISMDLPATFLKKDFDVAGLMSFIKTNEITGTLTYPHGKKTPIQYEIVNHRKQDDIYMKSSLGYFLWEMLEKKDDQLGFAIYWWYCPPAQLVDLEILEMTAQLLADFTNWHQTDDRQCDDDIETKKWSLFCALKHSSIEKMREYNHHNTAMQAVRFTIDEVVPGHGFAHTLMDYNNEPNTSHQNILGVIERAKTKLVKEMERE